MKITKKTFNDKEKGQASYPITKILGMILMLGLGIIAASIYLGFLGSGFPQLNYFTTFIGGV